MSALSARTYAKCRAVDRVNGVNRARRGNTAYRVVKGAFRRAGVSVQETWTIALMSDGSFLTVANWLGTSSSDRR